MDLPYDVIGDGPPVVLLTGLGLNRSSWRPVLPLLGDRWRLFTLDLPRFWDRRGGSYTVPEVAQRLANWHRAQGLPPCPWVGWSLGGQICVHLAAVPAGEVSALVLVEPSLPASFTAYSIADMLGDMLRSPLPLWWQVLCGLWTHGFRSAVRAVRSAGDDGAFQGLLGRVAHPTLVVYGDRDGFIPARRLPALAEAIPRAERKVIRDAGHAVIHTHPAELAEALGEFLGRQPGVER